MTAAELLQYTNLLFIPALIYIVKLETRMAVIETRLESFMDNFESSHQ